MREREQMRNDSKLGCGRRWPQVPGGRGSHCRRGGNDGTHGEKALQECICWEDELEEAQAPAGGFCSHHLYPGTAFPGIFCWPAPEVTQMSCGFLCHLSSLGKTVPTSGVALPPRQRWMTQHKLSPPKQSLRWTSLEFRSTLEC